MRNYCNNFFKNEIDEKIKLTKTMNTVSPLFAVLFVLIGASNFTIGKLQYTFSVKFIHFSKIDTITKKFI